MPTTTTFTSFYSIRAKVLVVYSAALLQGLSLVTFPALSNTFKTEQGVSDALYGAIFLPQVAFAVLGALLGSILAPRFGLRGVLVLALLANAAAQAALATSGVLGYNALLLGTSFLGAGFGLSAAPLNTYPSLLFPARRDTALVILHTSLGAGLALGPLLVGVFATHLAWLAFPLLLSFACLSMALWASLLGSLKTPSNPALTGVASTRKPGKDVAFWLFAVIAVLYAFAEGTFANWAVLYLAEEKGFDAVIASSALAIFWATLSLGRLLIAALLVYADARWFWRGLPWAMAAVFLALPWVASPSSGIALFAAAGFACSAFFPLTLGLAGRRYPNHLAWISSMLTAALMLGVGLGSWLVGWLRQMLPLEQLYQYSVVYPMGIIVLSLFLRKH